MQQAGVDAVALGEHFVQLYGAQHGTNVGHGQVDNRQLEVADFIGGFRRVDDLNKAHRINGDVGVIARNHLLRRDIEHLLHHINFAPDTIHKGHHQAHPRLQRLRIAAKALYRPLVALRNDFYRRSDDNQRDENKNGDKNQHQKPPVLLPVDAPGEWRAFNQSISFRASG